MRACSSTSYGGVGLSENSPRFGLALNPDGQSGRSRARPAWWRAKARSCASRTPPRRSRARRPRRRPGGRTRRPRLPRRLSSRSSRARQRILVVDPDAPGSSRTGCRRPPARPRGRPRQPNLRNARFLVPGGPIAATRDRARSNGRRSRASRSRRSRAVRRFPRSGTRARRRRVAACLELLARVHAHGEGDGDVREARRDGDGEHDRRDGLVHLVASVVEVVRLEAGVHAAHREQRGGGRQVGRVQGCPAWTPRARTAWNVRTHELHTRSFSVWLNLYANVVCGLRI